MDKEKGIKVNSLRVILLSFEYNTFITTPQNYYISKQKMR